MGLIAREIEARGIPTISLSSALSITQAVNPPRAVYLDYPLGHTAGKPDDKADQRKVMLGALKALETLQVPGEVVHLDNVWKADDAWKDRVMRPREKADEEDPEPQQSIKSAHEDDRVQRYDFPQYQHGEDADAVPESCPTCVFLEAPNA